MFQKTDEHLILTAGVLIARFGDQAYHQALALARAAKDLEELRRLRDVAAELRARGFHRHPVRDGEAAAATVNAFEAAEAELRRALDARSAPNAWEAAQKLARAAYDAGKRGEEWPG